VLAHPSLQHQAHRPWPLSSRSWLLRQTWHDLLFLHWPLPAAALRPLVPAPLSIDEFAGTAWAAVTPFWMSDIAIRNWPALPLLSRFDELNVRTYVRLADRPGVWFFSLDAGRCLGVWGARLLYGLPYVHARMHHRHDAEEIAYRSERKQGAGFVARYGPVGPITPSRPGSLEHWLTERYCLYAPRASGGLYRADIHHVPWPLQPASVTIHRNDMLGVHRIPIDRAPSLVHFSRKLEVIVWPRERVL
jgi:uncharacterized protein YqjF (DUF2071 family)